MKKNSRYFAIITGASSGIGFHLAKQFAEHGFDLLIISDSDKIFQAKEELQHYPVDIKTLQLNLSLHKSVEELYTYIKSTNRHIDVLAINAGAINAGIGLGGAFVENTIQSEFDVIDLNIKSAVHLAKYIVNDMIIQGFGKILFTASILAKNPCPYQAVYSGSKAFLYSFSQALRYELKDFNIQVTTLLPDNTDTSFIEKAGLLNTNIGRQDKDDPCLVARQAFEALMSNTAQVTTGSIKNRAKNTLQPFITSHYQQAKLYGELSKPDTLKNKFK